MTNNLEYIIDLLAELGRQVLEDQNADGDTLAGQPSAVDETTTNVVAQFDSTIEGER